MPSVVHVHSCETVLRISGVTLGVLLRGVGNGPALQPDILVAWATPTTKRGGSSSRSTTKITCKKSTLHDDCSMNTAFQLR